MAGEGIVVYFDKRCRGPVIEIDQVNLKIK
jgi:hypothetical protein